jgi:nucleoside-diphosphate-sugar epimerase
VRRVIITGGNGFVGSSLISRLVEMGVEVHALVNQNHQRLDKILPPECIHVLERYVSSSVATVLQVQPDTIFHLAAVYAEPVSAQCILSMIEGNLTLGACMLFAASQMEKKPVFVNTGTYWQFDAADSSFAPNTLYAATKHAFQDLLYFYRSRMDIASVTLVLYDTFGEKDTRNKLWQQLTSSSQGESILLSVGTQTIHLLHIDDNVNAFIQAATLLHQHETLGPIYSVSSPTPTPLRSLVEALNEKADLGLDLKWGAHPYWEGQVFEPWVGERLPGWEPQIEPLHALVQMAKNRRGSAQSELATNTWRANRS